MKYGVNIEIVCLKQLLLICMCFDKNCILYQLMNPTFVVYIIVPLIQYFFMTEYFKIKLKLINVVYNCQ